MDDLLIWVFFFVIVLAPKNVFPSPHMGDLQLGSVCGGRRISPTGTDYSKVAQTGHFVF